MTIKEIANKLLEEGYLVLVAGKPVLTARFERALGYEDKAPIIEKLTPKQVSNELVKPTTYTDNPKEVWNEFIENCCIPWRVKNNRGETYTLRHYSSGIAKSLMKIISDPNIDYTRLVNSTKDYYKNTSYKMLVSNYLSKEVWKDCYENYNKDKKSGASDGNAFWET